MKCKKCGKKIEIYKKGSGIQPGIYERKAITYTSTNGLYQISGSRLEAHKCK